MTTQEAINALEEMQSQIIHGSHVFAEIAEVVRAQQSEIAIIRGENEKLAALLCHATRCPLCSQPLSEDPFALVRKIRLKDSSEIMFAHPKCVDEWEGRPHDWNELPEGSAIRRHVERMAGER